MGERRRRGRGEDEKGAAKNSRLDLPWKLACSSAWNPTLYSSAAQGREGRAGRAKVLTGSGDGES